MALVLPGTGIITAGQGNFEGGLVSEFGFWGECIWRSLGILVSAKSLVSSLRGFKFKSYRI